jgi:chromosome partition protein MukF
MLIEDTAKLTGVLTEIEQAALAAEQDDALVALRQVSQELERVGAWGQERLEGWSEYFQYVHRYLRGIVRLDPDRGVTLRLRDGLKDWSNAPWFLVVADPLPYLHLREPEPIGSSTPVTGPLTDREPQPAEEDASAPSIEAMALVLAALGQGSVRLVDLLRSALPGATDRERYALAGRIAHALGSQGVVRYPRDEAWHSVLGDMEAQDWQVAPRNGT